MCCPAPPPYTQRVGFAREQSPTRNRKDLHMTTRSLTEAHLNHPQSQRAFRSTRLLVGGYLGISALTLAAIILLRDNAAVVTPAVWVRGTIVVASALLTTLF